MVLDSREQPGGTSITTVTSREVDPSDETRDGDLIVGEVLVEDISIDGMCGVY